jgi:hypothetical protein
MDPVTTEPRMKARSMNRHEFIETAPLYTRIELVGFYPPDSITRMCTGALCKRETTWSINSRQTVSCEGARDDVDFKVAAYTCVLCKQNSMAVIYQNLNWSPVSQGASSYQHTAVRKIGEVPQQITEIPAELNDRLGSTAGYYKKALICRGQNYGIGAMAYLRRVVDEKTDELIDVMAELARTFNVEEEEVVRLLAAKSEIRYENKLRVAADLIPDALRPGGVNPLGQLYHHISVGLHGKSDDECIAVFDDLKVDFEYVFRNLHLQAGERREFAKRVQTRAGRNPSVT